MLKYIEGESVGPCCEAFEYCWTKKFVLLICCKPFNLTFKIINEGTKQSLGINTFVAFRVDQTTR